MKTATADDELQQFVNNTIQQVTAGITDNRYLIPKEIDFEIAVTKGKSTGGKLSIKVLEAGGDITTEKVSKIRFKAERNYTFKEDHSTRPTCSTF